MTNNVLEHITVSSDDLDEARRLLAEVHHEMWRRNDEVVAGRGGDLRTGWTGSKIYLTVNNLGGITADDECSDLLSKILSMGRKLGITGVAYGVGELTQQAAGNSLSRDLLSAGIPLRYENTRQDRNQ